MAETPKTEKGKGGGKKRPPAPRYVTEQRFESLENGVGELTKLVRESLERSVPGAATPIPPAPETPLEKEVRKASADTVQHVPTDWDEKARDIIGEPLDHCEMTYGQNGGVRFIVVIKEEFSNAGKDYLSYYKQDRRTKDIAGDGIAGVENWCKLIKQNLARPNNR